MDYSSIKKRRGHPDKTTSRYKNDNHRGQKVSQSRCRAVKAGCESGTGRHKTTVGVSTDLNLPCADTFICKVARTICKNPEKSTLSIRNKDSLGAKTLGELKKLREIFDTAIDTLERNDTHKHDVSASFSKGGNISKRSSRMGDSGRMKAPHEEIVSLPAGLDMIVSNLGNTINDYRNATYQVPDIYLFWFFLISVEPEDMTERFLTIMVDDSKTRIDKIHQFQQLLEMQKASKSQDVDEDQKISEYQINKLHSYLERHVFNRKRVSFDFDALRRFANAFKFENDRMKLPPRLSRLARAIRADVNFLFIKNKMLSFLVTLDVFWGKLTDDGNGQYKMDLLAAVLLNEEPSITEIRRLQNDLNKRHDVFFIEEVMCSEQDSMVTREMVNQLEGYIRHTCFKSEVVSFSPEDLAAYIRLTKPV